MLYNQNPRIALIIIGNEILSGRTLDKNTQYVALKLAEHGIETKEVRVIPDIESEIIEAVNTLRRKFDYVITTGGIGPTHDDITTESIAKAFGVEVIQHSEAYRDMVEFYQGEENLNPGRVKMACVPEGAELIKNEVSWAPGFSIENVFVLAGVPKIMQSMMENVVPKMRKGNLVQSKTVEVKTGESLIAVMLTGVQDKFREVDIGSYPYMPGENSKTAHGTNIVFRSVDVNAIDMAVAELVGKLQDAKIEFEKK